MVDVTYEMVPLRPWMAGTVPPDQTLKTTVRVDPISKRSSCGRRSRQPEISTKGNPRFKRCRGDTTAHRGGEQGSSKRGKTREIIRLFWGRHSDAQLSASAGTARW